MIWERKERKRRIWRLGQLYVVILSECGEVSKAKDPRVPARLRSLEVEVPLFPAHKRVDQHCIASICTYSAVSMNGVFLWTRCLLSSSRCDARFSCVLCPSLQSKALVSIFQGQHCPMPSADDASRRSMESLPAWELHHDGNLKSRHDLSCSLPPRVSIRIIYTSVPVRLHSPSAGNSLPEHVVRGQAVGT